jgi:hypothetical protein
LIFSLCADLKSPFGGAYEKFTHSAVIMTNDGESSTRWNVTANDRCLIRRIFKDICHEGGHADQIISKRREPAVRGYVVSRRMAAREALEPLLGRSLSMRWKRMVFSL